jgi:GAF domain-containing protein/HAMP domain-containing protein
MKWTQRLTDFFVTSLQRKLMLAMSMVVTLAMIAFGFYLVNAQRQTKTAELEGRATRTINLLTQTITQPLWNVDILNMQAQVNAVMADREVNEVRITETGKSIPTIKSARETAAINPITRKADIFFQRQLGIIEIVYSSEDLNRSLAQTTMLVAGIILALIFLQVAVIYLLVGRLVTRPLHEMTDLTSRIAAGDLTGHVNLTSRDEMNILASAFNSMTAQLSQTLEGLEQRVKDRTADLEASKSLTEKHAKDLEAVADISRSVASIQEIDELLPTITRLISERYGFYHTGIYLTDETGAYAVLSAASSEGGQRLLEKKHKLRIEPSSLVGFAASRGQSRIASDVDLDSAYLAISDLPDTKSEAVLPLLAGSEIIGVLDVQSDQPNAFSEREVNILNTLANQVAISILNARSFGETRRALAEAEKIYRQFVQQGWGQIVKGRPVTGYRYSHDSLIPLDVSRTEVASPETQSLEANQKDQPATLSIPIKLRDQVIGTMRIRSTKPLREWDQDELALVQATAERAALALENARLLEDSQRRASKERIISDISAKITGSISMDNILKTAVEELGQVIPSAEVVIQFQNPDLEL